jgi:hypothetical protein
VAGDFYLIPHKLQPRPLLRSQAVEPFVLVNRISILILNAVVVAATIGVSPRSPATRA